MAQLNYQWDDETPSAEAKTIKVGEREVKTAPFTTEAALTNKRLVCLTANQKDAPNLKEVPIEWRVSCTAHVNDACSDDMLDRRAAICIAKEWLILQGVDCQSPDVYAIERAAKEMVEDLSGGRFANAWVTAIVQEMPPDRGMWSIYFNHQNLPLVADGAQSPVLYVRKDKSGRFLLDYSGFMEGDGE